MNARELSSVVRVTIGSACARPASLSYSAVRSPGASQRTSRSGSRSRTGGWPWKTSASRWCSAGRASTWRAARERVASLSKANIAHTASVRFLTVLARPPHSGDVDCVIERTEHKPHLDVLSTALTRRTSSTLRPLASSPLMCQSRGAFMRSVISRCALTHCFARSSLGSYLFVRSFFDKFIRPQDEDVCERKCSGNSAYWLALPHWMRFLFIFWLLTRFRRRSGLGSRSMTSFHSRLTTITVRTLS